MKKITLILSLLFFIVITPALFADDWPQVQKDPQHTGYSPETLGTNFRVAWTYPFQPDRVHPQTQAIIYQGKVFVGTEGANGRKPTLYAIDATTGQANSGKVAWTFEAGGPILNSVAADQGKIFFGAMDGAVYAVDANTGAQAWKQQLSNRKGFSTAPVVADGKVMLGGRDGYFYALDSADGTILWRYNAASPILQTAAYNNGRVFFGAMNMHVHGVNAIDGRQAWKSQRIPGLSFKDYWPVVTQGKVFIIPMADKTTSGIRPGFPFGWYGGGPASNWTWLSQWGSIIAAGNAVNVPDIMNAQTTVMNNYQANPGNYTKNLFILDETTGQEAMVVPHSAYQTMNGATAPPCVDRDGRLIIPIMFINSRWGRLDLAQGRITDILYDGYDRNGNPVSSVNTNPVGGGNSDENLAVSCATNLVLAFHFMEGNANYTGAFELNNRRWTLIGAGYRNRQMTTNTQGGGANPASISDGKLYHLVFHELVARTTQ